ncbi:MAG TPA: hypothetical protein VGW10_09060 [Solirubrobacteraceae bacterium]|nr:hypothetical protein [Solirubrobacteraceae bacterium]
MRWAVADIDDVPAGDGWLGADERAVLATLTGSRRRAEWRLGRWAAKQLLGAGAQTLVAADGAPVADLPVSISHRRGRALAAVADDGVAVGCDIEPLREDRDVVPFVAWEAAAKALRRPLLGGARPEVEVEARGFTVRWPDGAVARGEWWVDDGWAFAVARAGVSPRT